MTRRLIGSTASGSRPAAEPTRLVGTPQHVADEMVRMAEAGFAGTTLSFVNFTAELPYFVTEVLPLLERAGLRTAP